MTLLSILGIGGRAAKPTQNAWRVLTAATVELRAEHRDQHTGRVHPHQWKITAWVRQSRGQTINSIYLQKTMLEWIERHNGTCLPDSMAWGEDIARDMAVWLGQGIGRDSIVPLFNVHAVLVERPAEGLSAAWIA